MIKIIFILLIYFCVTVFTIPPASAECTIVWSGDLSGSVFTAETSRTQQATLEAFGGIFPQDPFTDCSAPYHCYCDQFPSWNNYSQHYMFHCNLVYGNGFLIAEDERTVSLNGSWNESLWSPLTEGRTVTGVWDVVCNTTTTTIIPTLIELSFFSATPKLGGTVLQWSTEAEINNAGFNLYRSESENGEYIKINPSLIPSQGSPTQGAAYEFSDKNVQNRKTYYYKMEDIDINGVSTFHGPESAMPRLLYSLGR